MCFATFGGNPNLHGDSLEAFTWGQEFQLGYYKHPPFWAWVAGLWFKLFPHKDWAFYLLSELNAALGILGAWAFIGKITKDPARLAATALLLLTSFYTFNALRFNANTMQLSLWPWAMYALLHSIERRTVWSGVLFGAIAAAAMLSKYYAGVLLLSCFVASLVHPRARAYYRSFAPWVAGGTFVLLLLPHLVWLVQNDFLPFTYAAAQTEYIKKKFFYTTGGFLVACAAFHAVSFGLVAAVRFFAGKDVCQDIVAPAERRFALVLGLLPFVLTLLVSLAGGRVTPNYVLPIFSLSPLLMLMLIRPDLRLVARLSSGLAVLAAVACLAASPLLYRLPTNESLLPRDEIVAPSLDAWAKASSGPLRLVAGTQPFSEALAFYAPGRVAHFPELSFKDSPWVTPQKIADEGMLIMCEVNDGVCLDRARDFMTAQTVRSERTVVPRRWNRDGPAVSFVFFATPPGAAR